MEHHGEEAWGTEPLNPQGAGSSKSRKVLETLFTFQGLSPVTFSFQVVSTSSFYHFLGIMSYFKPIWINLLTMPEPNMETRGTKEFDSTQEVEANRGDRCK